MVIIIITTTTNHHRYHHHDHRRRRRRPLHPEPSHARAAAVILRLVGEESTTLVSTKNAKLVRLGKQS